jgi:hypothetical protein
MKKLETQWTCKCGAIRNVMWFSSQENNFINTISTVHCLMCLAEMNMKETRKFNVSDIEGYLVTWGEEEL